MGARVREIRQSLQRWITHLTCPVCSGAFVIDELRVVCMAGHSFDVARQGYLNLGASQKDARADNADMVLAREAVQLAGVFDGVAEALCDAVAQRIPETPRTMHIADLAGGTGFYTSRVLQRLDTARGLVLDLSVPALKRAAQAHPALAAVGADLTAGIPLRDSSIDLALNVFGPRNGDEIRRVLTPSGSCIVVTPTGQHLKEIVDPLGMLQVAPNKAERVAEAMRGFTAVDAVECTYQRDLTRADIVHLIAMGPSAHHLTRTDIETRVAGLSTREGAATLPVTVSVNLTTFQPD